jgi:5-methylcytosine-specific restriction endonuclease McrA
MHPKGIRCEAFKREYKGGDERIQRSTRKWTEKSKEIREKANHLCEICRDRGAYIYEGLEVHHIIKVRDDGQGLLDDTNLLCVCTTHHKQCDRGEIDIDYQKMLARRREGLEDGREEIPPTTKG